MTMTIDDLLGRAEKAPRPHRDVDVYLDTDAAGRLEQLQADLEALEADKRLVNPRQREIEEQIAAVQAEAASSLIVLRFTKLPGEEWVNIVARYPQRVDVGVDRMYGYNVHAVCRAAAAVSGVRLNGDSSEALSDEQWDRLFALISGHEFSNVCDAIFGLNEYGPELRVAEAKKASSAGTDGSSASPSV